MKEMKQHGSLQLEKYYRLNERNLSIKMDCYSLSNQIQQENE